MPVSDASILKSTLAWGCGSSTWSLLAVSRRDQPLQLCRLHVEAGPTASPVRCPLCLSKAVIYSTPPERPVVAACRRPRSGSKAVSQRAVSSLP